MRTTRTCSTRTIEFMSRALRTRQYTRRTCTPTLNYLCHEMRIGCPLNLGGYLQPLLGIGVPFSRPATNRAGVSIGRTQLSSVDRHHNPLSMHLSIIVVVSQFKKLSFLRNSDSPINTELCRGVSYHGTSRDIALTTLVPKRCVLYNWVASLFYDNPLEHN